MSSGNRPDITQFESIVDQFQDRLFRFAFMRIGKREDAEDIVQEVLISLYRKMNEGKKIKDYEHYLLYSISNACTDYYRKNRKIIISVDEALEIPNEADRQIYEEYRRVKKLLDDLPPEQAETLRLKCYDGLTFRQIAEIYRIPEATVKSRYKYAISHIQQKLKREDYE